MASREKLRRFRHTHTIKSITRASTITAIAIPVAPESRPPFDDVEVTPVPVSVPGTPRGLFGGITKPPSELGVEVGVEVGLEVGLEVASVGCEEGLAVGLDDGVIVGTKLTTSMRSRAVSIWTRSAHTVSGSRQL